MRALRTWYLLPKEFVIHNDHESLKNLRGQGIVWEDLDFSESFAMCFHSKFHDFFRHDGFLFKEKRLCMPMSLIPQFLMKEAHEGGLMDHFGELKTFEILNEHFYWPHMRKDVHNICERCITCKLANLKCHIMGNLCYIIIDGGNCVNVASERLVRKLVLPTIVHPRLYTLQWLSEHGMLVFLNLFLQERFKKIKIKREKKGKKEKEVEMRELERSVYENTTLCNFLRHYSERSESSRSLRRDKQERLEKNGRDNREVRRERNRRGREELDMGKCKIPTFLGNYKLEELKVEQILGCFDYIGRMMVRLVTLEFSEYALVWWNQVLEDVRRGRRNPCVSWASLKRMMREIFAPSSYTRDFYIKL
ncbi:hypothetical protein CR513_35810, partial [Mucuna pruriens]